MAGRIDDLEEVVGVFNTQPSSNLPSPLAQINLSQLPAWSTAADIMCGGSGESLTARKSKPLPGNPSSGGLAAAATGGIAMSFASSINTFFVLAASLVRCDHRDSFVALRPALFDLRSRPLPKETGGLFGNRTGGLGLSCAPVGFLEVEL